MDISRETGYSKNWRHSHSVRLRISAWHRLEEWLHACLMLAICLHGHQQQPISSRQGKARIEQPRTSSRIRFIQRCWRPIYTSWLVPYTHVVAGTESLQGPLGWRRIVRCEALQCDSTHCKEARARPVEIDGDRCLLLRGGTSVHAAVRWLAPAVR